MHGRTSRAARLVAGPILAIVLALPAAAPARGASAVAAGGPAPEGWLEAATSRIRRMEYRFSEDSDGGWSAPNREHGIRARIGAGGVELVPRRVVAGEASWRVGVRLAAYGREGHLVTVIEPELRGEPDRLRLDRGDLVEWYANGPDGLEQGFDVHSPPPDAAGPLVIEMAISGNVRARRTGDGRAVVFHAGAREVLRYSGLKVADAVGNEIPAELDISGDRLLIRIHDAGATYPLAVDPFFTSVAWSVLGAHANELGWSVATAGDVNGDGFSDVIIGVPQWNAGGSAVGAAFLFMGSSAGLPSSPDWQATGGAAFEPDFGWSVATAGDVNADGYDDILVGAPHYQNGGAAFLWLGGPGGPGADGTPANADWSHLETQVDADFGWSVATAGDVDLDGDDDILVGSPRYTHDQFNEGRVFLFLGVATGLAVLPAWTAESDQSCADIFCAQAGFGWSVAGAGDMNGDGFPEIAVGSPRFENGTSREGAAFVWYGHAGLLSGPDGRPTNASWYAESGQDQANFGESVAVVGDVDGDGFADLLVGGGDLDGPTTAGAGAALLWLGGPAGLGPIGSPANAYWSASSDQAGDRFGASVATAGDINGDGFSDLIIGAPAYHNFGFAAGAVFVWFGGPAGPAAPGTPTSADWWTAGPSQSSFGASVATAGDVDGDGFGDFLIGSPLYDGPGTASDNGRAALHLGHSEGLAAWIQPTPWEWEATGGQTGGRMGACLSSAGDVNGDGFSDLLIGAPDFDDGEAGEGKLFLFLGSPGGLFLTPSWSATSNQVRARLGTSVAGVHDINGDGYDDVAAGAPGYDQTRSDEGAVFVWFGGPATGFDPAGMGAPGTPANADWSFLAGVRDARLGSALAAAGDVNADGLADMIVSAPFYTNGEPLEGKVWVLAGDGSGVPTVFWSLESNAAGWRYGDSVSAAGDVNGDGFGDIALGMPFGEIGDADEGVAQVFHGGPVTMETPATFVFASGQMDAHLGQSVTTAGDVNGDGYSDLVVGAPDHDSASFTDEGKAWLFYGGPAGLVAPAAWYAVGDLDGVRLGASAAAAGDLNRDGFADIVIGMPDFGAGAHVGEGAALVWLGGAGGLGPVGTWLFNDGRLEGNQGDAFLGTSVASAGDVNGDGCSDLLLGAPGFDDTLNDEGLARVWYGNGGLDGLHVAPQQYRADDSAPIGHQGRSDSPQSFRVRALGRSPVGRTEVRLQWEVKPLGVPFDGTGIQMAPSTTDTGAPGFIDGSAAPLSEEVTGLTAGTFYHWRVRIASSSPFFPRSPWFSPPANSWNETDLRTDGCVDRDGDGYGSPADLACPGGMLLDCDDGEPGVSPGAPESCNNLDDDCDGVIDEGDPGGGAACNTGLYGECSLGVTTCSSGLISCSQTTFPEPETCDGIDNDCDGTIDGFPTSCGIGGCSAVGHCVVGTDTCTPGTPQPEICDGIDNDCDGTVPPEEIDSDGDGYSVCAGDCDDTAFGSIATPQPVTGLQINPVPAGYRLTWDSQDFTTGRDTAYDVFSGALSRSLPSGDYSTGACLEENVLGSESYDETTSDPAPGEIRYFILRGQNFCPDPTGTYGTKNRDLTAGASPAACN